VSETDAATPTTLPRGPISDQPHVTVIVPARNEERYIEVFLENLLQQDYPQERTQILIADGQSTDRTAELVLGFRDRLPNSELHENVRREKAAGLNLCIPKATGELILIMDAHTHYPPNYVSRLVAQLRETGADYVGGCVETEPGTDSYAARAIARALCHPFGVGGGTYRTNSTSGDGLAPFGCYRRELPFAIGGYNECLPRSEDDEFSARIKRHGGRCMVCGDVCSTYFARPTLRALCKQMFHNGATHIATFLELPGHFLLRHYVPFGFVTAVVLGVLLWVFVPGRWELLAAVLAPYLLLTIASSVHAAMRGGWRYLPALLVIFPIMHTMYGLGTYWGILTYGILKRHRRDGRRSGRQLIQPAG